MNGKKKVQEEEPILFCSKYVYITYCHRMICAHTAHGTVLPHTEKVLTEGKVRHTDA